MTLEGGDTFMSDISTVAREGSVREQVVLWVLPLLD
jgi:hypothetical protein